MPPPELLLPLGTIAGLAGLVQGLSGFGSALIAVPLLALLLPLETVAPLMALIGTAISALNLVPLRHGLQLGPMRPLLVGYLLGTPLGLYLLAQVPEALALGLFGALLCIYAGATLAGRPPRARWLGERPVPVGLIAGALGAAYSTSGPPVILHIHAQPGWSTDRRKATLVLFFLLSGGITLVAYGLGGLLDIGILHLFLWSAPPLLAGTLAGAWLYRRLGERGYHRLTFMLLLATGGLLVGRALA